MRLTLSGLAVLLMVGCNSGVSLKQGDLNDKRYFASERYIRVRGLNFPDYAKFAGWIGRHIEVQPVYKHGDPSLLRVTLSYTDFRNGDPQPVHEKRIGSVGTGIIRNNPRYLLCLRSIKKDDHHGVGLRLFINGYWFGISNHVELNEQVMFLPFPDEASSASFGYNLDEPLDEKIKWDEPFEIFRISLNRKTDEHGWTGSGYRRFYLTFSQSDN